MADGYLSELRAFRIQGGASLLTFAATALYHVCLGVWNDQRRPEWTNTTHATLCEQSGFGDRMTYTRARSKLAETGLVEWSEAKHGKTSVSFKIIGIEKVRCNIEGGKMLQGCNIEGGKMLHHDSDDSRVNPADTTISDPASRARESRDREEITTTTAREWPELEGIPNPELPADIKRAEVRRAHRKIFGDIHNPILAKLSGQYPDKEERRHIVGYWIAVELAALSGDRQQITSALVWTCTQDWQSLDAACVSEAIGKHLELMRRAEPGTKPWNRVANIVRAGAYTQPRRTSDVKVTSVW